MRDSYVDRTLFIHDSAIIGMGLGHAMCAEHGTADSNGLATTIGVIPRRYHQGALTRKMATPIKTQRLFYKSFPKTKTKPAEDILAVSRSMPRLAEAFDQRESAFLPKMTTDWETNAWSAVATSWGSSGFVIRATSPAWREATALVHQALVGGTLCVGIDASNNPGINPGLALTDYTLLPDSITKPLAARDDEAYRLSMTAETTGISARLERAGKRLHALVPAWYEGDDSAYPVNFFINPGEQNANHGWYTVEDLDAWILNTGPVVLT